MPKYGEPTVNEMPIYHADEVVEVLTGVENEDFADEVAPIDIVDKVVKGEYKTPAQNDLELCKALWQNLSEVEAPSDVLAAVKESFDELFQEHRACLDTHSGVVNRFFDGHRDCVILHPTDSEAAKEGRFATRAVVTSSSRDPNSAELGTLRIIADVTTSDLSRSLVKNNDPESGAGYEGVLINVLKLTEEAQEKILHRT